VVTVHGAAASAAGYQYQTWWGLLEMLRTGPDHPDGVLSMEMHDDVAWDENGSPTELLQMKTTREPPGRSAMRATISGGPCLCGWKRLHRLTQQVLCCT
jgi:hypothetical protein